MTKVEYELFVAYLQDGYIGRLVELVEEAGGEERLYEDDTDFLAKDLNLTPRLIAHIINRRNTFDPDNMLRIMEDEHIDFVRFWEDKYPGKLRNIPGPPYALFVKGELPSEDSGCVAIIGARNCSEYGRLMAEYFGDRLARDGIDIVSGMAYGIDGIAQMAAIDAGGKSYSVLGCGVDVVYPPSNRRLYERLSGGCGGVISEYSPGTTSASRNFPPRNRIISGLSDVLLVVEAKAKSGTLITVDQSIEQGKEVMVVPGRITDPLSVGCLNIMGAGAMPALSPSAVSERVCEIKAREKSENRELDGQIEMRVEKWNEIKKKNQKKTSGGSVADLNLTHEEEAIYRLLDFYPKSAELIALEANIDISKVLMCLTNLEIKNAAKCSGQCSFSKTS